jgi:hypothetical protein
MRLLELFELQSQERPHLACYRSDQPVLDENLGLGDGRWLRFAAEAVVAGLRSVHALPMR